MKALLSIGLFLVWSCSTFGQNEDLGNWIMYFGQNRFSDKLSLHTEIQYRNHTAVPTEIEQLLTRIGLNYHLDDQNMITAGYGYISSYEYLSEQSIPESEEHRIWQQFISINHVSKVKLEHRYRLEQRWVNSNYRNRIRYRLMAFVPLYQKEDKKLFIGLYDEIFMNTREVFFDRNRLYGALGYQFNKEVGVQTGMLHQQVGPKGKWYLQFAVFYNPDFRKN